mgnify:CR=1 FL=1
MIKKPSGFTTWRFNVVSPPRERVWRACMKPDVVG